ncbi:MAG: hypothetical protein EOO11_13750 [Chitinophagaceae bacterium]|nr:MAG: hypothetical protein EOO11_13750 [Chitinophagaceae bacterium]
MRPVTLLLFAAALLSSLASCAQKPAWKGTITYEHAGDINAYEPASKKDKLLFQKATQPAVAADGELYFVSDAFPKAKYLVRKRTATGQFRDVLDMSSENPDYKQALADYSIIRNTGISAVLSSLSDPRLSPNGKYLAVTVYGYKGQAFEKNCVAVFDVATRKLVTRFDDKYYGQWLPDGRLLLSGAHKNESVNGSLYQPATPGIFLTDAALGNPTRIDPELDDPAPYHATPSPDGSKLAFILNNHLWVMNRDGSGARQLTDTDRDNIETYPCWSPDGKWIACWVYKTFERSYYTAIAIVPAAAPKPVVLSDKAPVWPRDSKGFRISGGAHQMSWR